MSIRRHGHRMSKEERIVSDIIGIRPGASRFFGLALMRALKDGRLTIEQLEAAKRGQEAIEEKYRAKPHLDPYLKLQEIEARLSPAEEQDQIRRLLPGLGGDRGEVYVHLAVGQGFDHGASM